MSPKSIQQLLETVETGTHFLFTVVRHPFDRLISAYRDRILNGCTDQAKHHIPGIFKLTRPHLLNLGTFHQYLGKIISRKKTYFLQEREVFSIRKALASMFFPPSKSSFSMSPKNSKIQTPIGEVTTK